MPPLHINPETCDITLSETFFGKRETRLSHVVFSGISPEELLKSGVDGAEKVPLRVKVRYNASMEECDVVMLDGGEVLLKFFKDLRIAKGQSAVVYKDGVVMLGGIIEG